MYLGNSALIALITVLFAVTGSIVLGILAGLYRDRWPDHLISTVSLVGMSVPEFVVATVLVLCFSVALPWFPRSCSTVPTRASANSCPPSGCPPSPWPW